MSQVELDTALALFLKYWVGRKVVFAPMKAITLSTAITSSISSLFFCISLVQAKTFQLKNWGLDEKGAKIQKTWALSKGSKNIVVAVIDTGIDAQHPDLKASLWKAPSNPSNPKSANSGSNYGWDFVTRSANPIDPHGHGTHIAGIIAAASNPKTGTMGVAPEVQIMPVRYYSESAPGNVNLANTIKALHYAIDNGARIINYSGGGPEYSEEEFQAMKKAEKKGVLIVAAAGNDHRDTDEEDNRYYPAAYKAKGLTNIITVASLNSDDKLLNSSNWGKDSVDIGAPGEGILSTLPKGLYGKMSGTSQATAFVSGVAALILSIQPDYTPAQVKQIILDSADRVSSLYGKVKTGGKMNAYKAVSAVSRANSKLKELVRETASAAKPVSK